MSCKRDFDDMLSMQQTVCRHVKTDLMQVVRRCSYTRLCPAAGAKLLSELFCVRVKRAEACCCGADSADQH